MSTQGKNKILTGLVIVLLAANAITLGLFWFKKDNNKIMPPKGSPAEFLAKELTLDSTQKRKLEALVKEHRDAAEVLRKKAREAKESLFSLLKQNNVSDSVKQAAVKAVSAETEQLDLLTLDHFQKIRAICTPEQQQKFDEIILDIARMIGQPPGRPGGPAGPGGPGGPPPHGEHPPPPM